MAALAACWPGCFGKDGMFGCGGKCLALKSLHHFIWQSSKSKAKEITGNHINCLRHTGSAGCAEPLTHEWVGWRRWSILCRKSVPHINTVPNRRERNSHNCVQTTGCARLDANAQRNWYPVQPSSYSAYAALLLVDHQYPSVCKQIQYGESVLKI